MTDTTERQPFDTAWWGQFSLKRIGYHRLSDDSVSSAYLDRREMENRLTDVLASADIDRVWTSDENGVGDFEFVRESDDDPNEWGLMWEGLQYRFVWDDTREAVFCRNLGEEFYPHRWDGTRRWNSLRAAIMWTLDEISNIATRN